MNKIKYNKIKIEFNIKTNNINILIFNKLNINIIIMINKSDYRMTNLSIIKTDGEDKDICRKGKTLTKTLTFNFKNI